MAGDRSKRGFRAPSSRALQGPFYHVEAERLLELVLCEPGHFVVVVWPALEAFDYGDTKYLDVPGRH